MTVLFGVHIQRITSALPLMLRYLLAARPRLSTTPSNFAGFNDALSPSKRRLIRGITMLGTQGYQRYPRLYYHYRYL